MKRSVVITLKFLASIPLAFLVGGLAFKIFHEGTWLFAAAFAFLPRIVFDAIGSIAIIACWLGVWVGILTTWVFSTVPKK